MSDEPGVLAAQTAAGLSPVPATSELRLDSPVRPGLLGGVLRRRARPTPAVSIVIPTRNGQATLSEALRSLRRQTLGAWEAIVVDDGSTDGTAALADAWSRRDPRIRRLAQSHGGAASARNFGAAAARSEWLLFLDCDDRLTRGALEALLQQARRRPEADVVVARALVELPDGRRRPQAHVDLSDPFGFFCAEGRIAIHSAIVRRALFMGLGGFDPALKTSEDWDLWQRLARAGAAFVQARSVTAVYRNRRQSLSKDIRQAAADGLVVLHRGHGPDPRVAGAKHAAGAPADALPAHELSFLLWCAARDVALGGDGLDILALRRVRGGQLEPAGLGELLAAGMADALAAEPASLGPLWTTFAPKLERLLKDVGERQRRETLAIIKARLNGARPRDPDVIQLDAPADPAGRSHGEVLQLRWGERTLGAVAAHESEPAALADQIAASVARLPLRPMLEAVSVWRAPGVWLRAGARFTGATASLILSGREPADWPRWLRGVARVALLNEIQALVLARLAPARGAPARDPELRPKAPAAPVTPRTVAPAVPVLMYHRVARDGAGALDRYRITPEAFEAQLATLRQAGYATVSTAQLAAFLRLERPLPARSVMLTFDDGYLDFETHAWPLLRRYGFEATAFVIPGKVGTAADWDAALGEPAPLMDWRTLAELARAGLDIQSHSLTHRQLTELTPDEIREEARGSRERIAALTGAAPGAFCYPFDARDLTVETLVEASGYELAFAAGGGVCRLGAPRARLPRIEVAGDDDLETFRRKLGLA